MKFYDLKLDKKFVYALMLVLILVFALFFLNKYFDISTSSLTVRNIP